jgi:hypothetical protein
LAKFRKSLTAVDEGGSPQSIFHIIAYIKRSETGIIIQAIAKKLNEIS